MKPNGFNVGTKVVVVSLSQTRRVDSTTEEMVKSLGTILTIKDITNYPRIIRLSNGWNYAPEDLKIFNNINLEDTHGWV